MGFNVGFPSLEEMVFGDSTFTTNENVAFASEMMDHLVML